MNGKDLEMLMNIANSSNLFDLIYSYKKDSHIYKTDCPLCDCCDCLSINCEINSAYCEECHFSGSALAFYCAINKTSPVKATVELLQRRPGLLIPSDLEHEFDQLIKEYE